MTKASSITMAARAVIARGYAFSPWARSFADVDVVLDEIAGLPPPPEPLVLRVTATGGDAVERARVEGDWLCDAALVEPRRIPAPAWAYSEEAAAWAKGRPWLEAWETCPDARWMLHAAAKVVVDRSLVVRVTCACARTALDRVPAGEERPRRALETAEAWTRGEATLRAVRQAAYAAATYAANAADASDYAAAAAADAAFYAAHAAANAAYAAANAAYASANTAAYAADAADAARSRALARLAELVRGEIATWVVLRAAVQRAVS